MQNRKNNNIDNSKLDLINKKVIELSHSPDFLLAKELALEIISLLGVDIPERQGRYSFLQDQKFNKNENWFEWHNIFPDKRAGEILNHSGKLPLEIKMYWVNKATPSRIKGIVRFTDNYEDSGRAREEGNTKVGIDIIINPKADGLILALSNYGVVRILEIKDRLNNTQKKILSDWISIGSGEYSSDRGYLHKSLWDSFEIKTVNEEFYLMISQTFTILKQHLTEKKILNEDDSKQFSNRLIGRLLFVWFLRKKNFISEEKISYFNTDKISDEEYYTTRLEKLFFDTLNKPMEARDALKDDLKTPYLNGGLFYRYNNDSPKNGFLFPSHFFSNLYQNFNEYNFTTDESTPDFEQVAIDPEMLGRIFENLLASMMTETGEQARKAKGAFYTPREIVQYMCRESIRKYLYANIDIEKHKLEIDRLIDTPDHEWAINESNKVRDVSKKNDFGKRVFDTISNMKVLDPACGSGAFPIGMLQNLLRIYKRLNRAINEYETKIKILEKNIYGVDIEPMAVEISRLRAFLALVVDQEYNEKNKNGGVDTLPNLEFKFVCADTLNKLIKQSQQEYRYDGLPIKRGRSVDLMKELLKIKKKYFKADWEEKLKLENQLDQKIGHRGLFESKKNDQLRSYHPIRQISPATFYDPLLMHDVEKGFDIVIGNPPYGGTKISDGLKKELDLRSKDIYGAFISRSINGENAFLIKEGILSFIVSDTFMTIKTHLPLRRQIMNQRIHRMIRVHPDTFKATVNTAIILLQKIDQGSNGICEMADLTNINIHEDHETFLKILEETKDDKLKDVSTDKYAIYYYSQNLIKICEDMPFFVGSQKLFSFMNNTTAETIIKSVGDKSVKIRKININKKNVEVIRFGDVADVRQGLATGDNNYYLYQNPQARGNYKNIDDYKKYLFTEKDLQEINSNEQLRKKAIEMGFHKTKDEKNFDEDLWFNGRYILPHDKGGESDVTSGWLPNYYVPTDYFIDWSQEAVARMKSLTIKQRNKLHGKMGGKDVQCAVIRNPETYFKNGITLSHTGVYSPMFRINNPSPYNVGGSCIFHPLENYQVLAILNSKLIKYIFKNAINHTVNASEDPIKEIPFVFMENNKLVNDVKEIIRKQKFNLRYDYMSNEQKEIDKLVYGMYGLNEDDIQEVEKWYARRYPKLRKWCYIKEDN